MKHLLLVSLCFVCLGAFAQSGNNNHAVGFYYDLAYKPTDVDEDITYKPDKRVKFFYEIGEAYTPAYYYDLNNKKINGYIQFSHGKPDIFWYKEMLTSKKVKVTPEECLGFVIGADSFAIIQNFGIERKIGSKHFAEIIDKFDNYVFYKHVNVDLGEATTIYVVGLKNTGKNVRFPKTKNGFKDTATLVFGSFPWLVKKIQTGGFKHSDLPQIIKIFKYKKYFDNNRHVYYNEFGDETDDTLKAINYAIIHSVFDSIFTISHHNNQGTMLYKGNYTSFFPHEYVGDFTWYYSGGAKRKTVSYVLGKPTTTTTYFHNGGIHYSYSEEDHVYNKVLNDKGESMLNAQGNGTETFFDSIAGKKITCAYEDFKIKSAYYLDADNRKVYRYCDKNARLKDLSVIQASLYKFEFPESSILAGSHGIAMVRCVVEPSGLVSEMQLLKGVDDPCDTIFMGCFSQFKDSPKWKSAENGDEKVAQEIIIPVDCFVLGFSWYRNNYYNNSHFMNQQMRQNMMPPAPKLPAGGFR